MTPCGVLGHHHHPRRRLREVALLPSGPPQVSDIVWASSLAHRSARLSLGGVLGPSAAGDIALHDRPADRCTSFGDKTGLRLDLTILPCYLGHNSRLPHGCRCSCRPSRLSHKNGDSCNVSGCFHVAIAGRYHAMPPPRPAPIGPVQTAVFNSKAPGRSSLRITQCCSQCPMSPC